MIEGMKQAVKVLENELDGIQRTQEKLVKSQINTEAMLLRLEELMRDLIRSQDEDMENEKGRTCTKQNLLSYIRGFLGDFFLIKFY